VEPSITQNPMDVLVLGGTRFVGRHLVGAALARGHRVTLFNRGETDPDAFPEAERIRGDRARGEDLEALRGRRWDAVLDTSGYVPRDVRASAEALAGAGGHYVFVSTGSVYADLSAERTNEDAPLHPPDWESTDHEGDRYGPMKVACELAVREAFPERALVVRPGLVVGPQDHTDRFPYWVRRIRAGGRVLAPGDPARPVQVIDARDLGDWLVRMAEDGRTGTFNAVGPGRRLTMGKMLETIRAATGSDARFTWVPEAFLLEQGVTPWSDLPLWLPEEKAGLLRVDNRRALRAGLRLRPLAETVRDLAAWAGTEHPPGKTAGISREREAEILRAWHAARGSVRSRVR
jgi:nucleoside-diphosphate-sugar epimerase